MFILLNLQTLMCAAMRGGVLLCLLSVWAGDVVDAINPTILANVIQKMRLYGLENRQYAMAVLLTQQQCTVNTGALDLGVQPYQVQTRLQDYSVYVGNRIIAAIPDTFHAEYLLLGHDRTNPSRVRTLLQNAGATDCIVFFSTYSPCLETCNRPGGRYSILSLLGDFKGWNDNRKAFVFSSVWKPTGQINPSRAAVLESFQRIDNFIPLYRCVSYQNNGVTVNACYRCITLNTTPATNDCLYGY